MTENGSDENLGTLTLLLDRARHGETAAQNQFCELVYDKLCELARSLINRGDNDNGLQTTDLVNELFLDFLGREAVWDMPNRRYFFAVAIDQMRRILVDHYRRRETIKAGGQFRRAPLDDVMDAVLDEHSATFQCTVMDLEQALDEIRQESRRQYDVILHRFYGGLSNDETAEVLGVSLSTVESDWRLARAKLRLRLGNDADGTKHTPGTN